MVNIVIITGEEMVQLRAGNPSAGNQDQEGEAKPSIEEVAAKIIAKTKLIYGLD